MEFTDRISFIQHIRQDPEVTRLKSEQNIKDMMVLIDNYVTDVNSTRIAIGSRLYKDQVLFGNSTGSAKHGFYTKLYAFTKERAVSYTHLTLPTIYSV